MMRRVAVLTNYYKIYNLGASLQAYALNHAIRSMGYECETLCYSSPNAQASVSKKLFSRLGRYRMNSIRLIPELARRFRDLRKTAQIKKIQRPRFERFDEFCDTYIPHSAMHYTTANIVESLPLYDIFVTGSDQVWTMDGAGPNPDYFLEFVPDTKGKVAYAAGMCSAGLTREDRAYLQWALESFDSISVREENTLELIKGVSANVAGKSVRTIDPTFLLTAAEWQVIARPPEIPDGYVFAYFLSPNPDKHRIVSEYARLSGKTLVTLANINGRFQPLDECFGDVRVNDCGPREFLGYIGHAEMVFTDSFHGLSFCINYSKPFFVFRKEGDAIELARNNRIDTMLKLFDLNNRVISECTTAEELLHNGTIVYAGVQEKVCQEREHSLAWLRESLKESVSEQSRSVKQIAASLHCCGCEACANVCPTSCITMTEDGEGFLRPRIDHAECIRCGKCRSVCPVLVPPERNGNLKAFFVKSADEDDLERSTSGGAFSLLAREVLRRGGVVYGAAFDDKMTLHHARVDCIDNLQRLTGSKYLQSSLGRNFGRVRTDLDSGKPVLFVGTPCQAAALRSYLGKHYDNFLLVDFICHGVASPQVWSQYLSEMESRYNSRAISACFRSKRLGYANPKMLIRFESGVEYEAPVGDDLYFRAFLMNLCCRPSCHNCMFKGLDRCSDITLADFYGIENCVKRYVDDDRGVSLVLCHTDYGHQSVISATIGHTSMAVDPFEAIAHNGMCVRSCKSHRLRERFFEERDDGLETFFQKHFKSILLANRIKRTHIGGHLYSVFNKMRKR